MQLSFDKESTKVVSKATKLLRKSQACILAVEEISELQTEIIAFEKSSKNYQEFCEELADVTIMLNLVMGSFSIKKSDVQKKISSHYYECWAKGLSKKEILTELNISLNRLVKVICKAARKRHIKNTLIEQIAYCESLFEHLISTGLVMEKDYKKWQRQKLARMQKRAAKHNLL